MTQGPWLNLLNSLPLSRTEKAVVQRFASDTQGRAFLPVSDILRSHRKFNEALELLINGVHQHPNFAVARVVLAREYFNKGMIVEAYECLTQSPVSLTENVLAQKLSLKASLLLGYEQEFVRIASHMKKLQMMDVECSKLLSNYEHLGLEASIQDFLVNLKQKGIEPIHYHHAPAKDIGTQSHVAEAEVDLKDPIALNTNDNSMDAEVQGPEPLQAPKKSREDSNSFYVMSLAEVFRGGDEKAWGIKTVGGLELDSTTLGEIYAKQGHFTKALAVYKRLLSLNPSSELLRKRVVELSALEKEQRQEDEGIEPEVMDVIESKEVIDRQIKFYEALLNGLDG